MLASSSSYKAASFYWPTRQQLFTWFSRLFYCHSQCRVVTACKLPRHCVYSMVAATSTTIEPRRLPTQVTLVLARPCLVRCRSQRQSDTVMYSPSQRQSDTVMYSPSQRQSDTVMYSPSQRQSDTVMYSPSQRQSDTVMYSPSQRQSDTVMYSTSQRQSDTVKYSPSL